MKYDRVYNFSAGPSILPVEVLERLRDESRQLIAELQTKYCDIAKVLIMVWGYNELADARQ